MLFLIPPPSSLSPLSQLCPSPPCDGRTGGGPQCLGLRWGRHGVRFHGNSQSGIVTWSSSIYGVSKSVIYVCWWYLVSSHYWRNGGRWEEGTEERERKRKEGGKGRRGREGGGKGARWLFYTYMSQPVSRILVGAGRRVEGVALEDGAEVRAKIVLSNATPKITFLDLLPKARKTIKL